MTPELADTAIIVARILVGALFIIGGLRHFPVLDAMTAAMKERGVPQARLVLIVGSIYQIVLGITLALGLFAAASALGLILFTVLATVMMLNFWDKEGPQRAALFNGFMSNVAIIGGLLALAATG
ncbi:DoxX family protein [Pelagibacterium sp. H642]|uniref:DoxX family protein n=1 Tax=Pelagibacterium sp. H642 TaxID=1881069 RepID=UPI002814E48B|nr:DoxX family protein [Pelagibacterium sp. H642]WMT91371.1 DoxX family protein [Pelagibacterium sp. H642]